MYGIPKTVNLTQFENINTLQRRIPCVIPWTINTFLKLQWICSRGYKVIGHIQHLLTTELAQTMACSLILSRIDYCNAASHGDMLQHEEVTACAEQYSSDRSPSAKMIQRQPVIQDVILSAVQQRLVYKVALLAFKVCNKLVAWLSGRTSVFGRRTFSVLRSTCS